MPKSMYTQNQAHKHKYAHDTCAKTDREREGMVGLEVFHFSLFFFNPQSKQERAFF